MTCGGTTFHTQIMEVGAHLVDRMDEFLGKACSTLHCVELTVLGKIAWDPAMLKA
jgi:hypothetical protein